MYLRYTLIGLFVMLWLSLYGQCDQNIILSDQEDIDNFDLNYGCTEIRGNLFISGAIRSIKNLDGLSKLTSIEGSFEILAADSLINLDGLSNITHIGGRITLIVNDELTNLDGLQNLENKMGGISIGNNPKLTEINGFPKVTEIDGDLSIYKNASLQKVEGFDNVTAVNGSVRFNENISLTKIDFLNSLLTIGGGLGFDYHPLLTTIQGLRKVQSVERSFTLFGNEALEDLNGLSSIQSIKGEIRATDNHALISFDGLQSLTYVGGDIDLQLNDALIDIDAFYNLNSLGAESEFNYSVNIQGNPSLSKCCVIKHLATVMPPEHIEFIFLDDNLPGCNSIEEIEADCLTPIKNNGYNEVVGKVFPNPTRGVLYIENHYLSDIQIYNSIGETVLKKRNQNQTVLVDISNFPAGVYFLKMEYQGKPIVEKIIKF